MRNIDYPNSAHALTAIEEQQTSAAGDTPPDRSPPVGMWLLGHLSPSHDGVNEARQRLRRSFEKSCDAVWMALNPVPINLSN